MMRYDNGYDDEDKSLKPQLNQNSIKTAMKMVRKLRVDQFGAIIIMNSLMIVYSWNETNIRYSY